MNNKNNEYVICTHCGDKIYYNLRNKSYMTNSEIFKNTGIIPCCKKCMDEIYDIYYSKYKSKYKDPVRKTIQKICMIYDLYYDDHAIDIALNKSMDRQIPVLSAYFSIINLRQYKNKTYDDSSFVDDSIIRDKNENYVSNETIEFFGEGFTNDAYVFLKREYDDWITRNECNSKQQEEIFKNICFKQWELHLARIEGKDTATLDKSFREYLDSAGLQPKQKGQTISESQTFGTLINKWENEKPIPEPDEEFKDIDNIGLYIETFYKYHLAKMHGIKIEDEEKYNEVLKKYTVEKPIDSFNEDSNSVFDSIFGSENEN